MSAKIVACLNECRAGPDASLDICPGDWDSAKIEKAICMAFDDQDVGHEVTYSRSLESGEIFEGLDGKHYRLTIEEVGAVLCKFCCKQIPIATAHRHDGGYIGEECGCWDERLRVTE